MEHLNLQFQIKPGTDIVYMPRFIDKVDDARWITKILTPKEQTLFYRLQSPKRRLEFICGRFAAKEAYSKAKGVGIGEIDFLDVEILADDLGKPVSECMNVSISHDQDYALAMVIVYENI
ncbi:hypothetical protein AOC36_10495 [Erysipelothrix larvae]|uniref:Holo-[acyl-carrier-protein] synthase n=1 Tax=Erysipelothrix larvae TaxID=1514105 RepID=A0A0X8H1N4_9FIRM|nr:holo-ACP synthase [Erysipelothrix larvae]AMC94385.1 hypothetical protein AOC36_10495 [Erysipelothrix larvae]